MIATVEGAARYTLGIYSNATFGTKAKGDSHDTCLLHLKVVWCAKAGGSPIYPISEQNRSTRLLSTSKTLSLLRQSITT